jgi:apolipoprotein N-acyltransferase
MSKVLNYTNLYLSLLSGILLILIFPRFDLELVAWIALVPLLLSILIASDQKQAFYSGFITGFIYFLGNTYWVVNSIYYYGHLPFYLSILILLGMVLILSLYIGLFGFLYHLFSKRISLPSSILAPVLWTTIELARTYLLSGFPWASLGYSQYRLFPVIQMADITGVYGISFLVVAVNGAIADILIYRKVKRPLLLIGPAFSIILLIATIGYGFLRLSEIDQAKELKVSLVQGNIEQDKKWEPRFQREVFDTYLRLTREVLRYNPDIIIWPETATPFYFGRDRVYTEELISFVKESKIYLLFGTQRVKSFEHGKYYLANSAYLLSPAGEISGSYDKIHLVPFGEYVPIKGVLFFVDKLVEGIGDFTSGNRYEIFETPKGRFGTVICYEIIFPGLVRKFVKEGAEFMVTITNDAWFGHTSAPYQHFSMAVLRAVENRVSIARAANTGVSGFIDGKGKILKASDIFHEGTYTLNIKASSKKTFYTKHGDIFAYICLGLTLMFLLLIFQRTKFK